MYICTKGKFFSMCDEEEVPPPVVVEEERVLLLGAHDHLETGTVVEELTPPPTPPRAPHTEVNPLHADEPEPEPDPEGGFGGLSSNTGSSSSYVTNPSLKLEAAAAITPASSRSATYNTFALHFKRGHPYPLQAAQQRLALAGLAHWRLSATTSVAAFDGDVIQRVGHLVRSSLNIGEAVWVRPHERAPFRHGIVVGYRPVTGAPIVLPAVMGACYLTPSTGGRDRWITDAMITRSARSFAPEHTLFDQAHAVNAHGLSDYKVGQFLWVNTRWTGPYVDRWARGHVIGFGQGMDDTTHTSNPDDHGDEWRFDHFGTDALGMPRVQLTERSEYHRRNIFGHQVVWTKACVAGANEGSSTYPIVSTQSPFNGAWTLHTVTRNAGWICWDWAQDVNAGQHPRLQIREHAHLAVRTQAGMVACVFILLWSLMWVVFSSYTQGPVDVTVHIHDGVLCSIQSWPDSNDPVALDNGMIVPMDLGPLNYSNAVVDMRVTSLGSGPHHGAGTLLGCMRIPRRFGDTWTRPPDCEINFDNGGRWTVPMSEVMISGNDYWVPLSLSLGNHTIHYSTGSTTCGHLDRADTNRGNWEVIVGHVDHVTAASATHRVGGRNHGQESTTTESTWSVVSGQCTSSGGCFRSPNYPNSYYRYQSCSILAMGSGILSVKHFDTGSDLLRVGGHNYSGTGTSNGPAGIAITDGETITFDTDSYGQDRGFEICFGAERSATFSLSPDWGAGGDDSLTVVVLAQLTVAFAAFVALVAVAAAAGTMKLEWRKCLAFGNFGISQDACEWAGVMLTALAAILGTCFQIVTPAGPDPSYWQSWWDEFSGDSLFHDGHYDIVAMLLGILIGLFVAASIAIIQTPIIALVAVLLVGVACLLWVGVLAMVCSGLVMLCTAAWMQGTRTIKAAPVVPLRQVSLRLVWHCAQPIALLAWAYQVLSSSDGRVTQVIAAHRWPALLIAARGVACAVVTAECLCHNPAFLLIDITASARDTMHATGGRHVWAMYLLAPELFARLAILESSVEACCSCLIDCGGACALAGILLQGDFTMSMPVGQAFLCAQTTLSTVLSFWLTIQRNHPANPLRHWKMVLKACGILAFGALVIVSTILLPAFAAKWISTSWQLADGFVVFFFPVFSWLFWVVLWAILAMADFWERRNFRERRNFMLKVLLLVVLAVLAVVCATAVFSSDTADAVCSSEVAQYTGDQGLDAWQGDKHWWKRDGWVKETWYKFGDNHVLPLVPSRLAASTSGPWLAKTSGPWLAKCGFGEPSNRWHKHRSAPYMYDNRWTDWSLLLTDRNYYTYERMPVDAELAELAWKCSSFGGYPSVSDGITEITVCFANVYVHLGASDWWRYTSFRSSMCGSSVSVGVVNCGDHFRWRLPPAPTSYIASDGHAYDCDGDWCHYATIAYDSAALGAVVDFSADQAVMDHSCTAVDCNVLEGDKSCEPTAEHCTDATCAIGYYGSYPHPGCKRCYDFADEASVVTGSCTFCYGSARETCVHATCADGYSNYYYGTCVRCPDFAHEHTVQTGSCTSCRGVRDAFGRSNTSNTAACTEATCMDGYYWFSESDGRCKTPLELWSTAVVYAAVILLIISVTLHPSVVVMCVLWQERRS